MAIRALAAVYGFKRTDVVAGGFTRDVVHVIRTNEIGDTTGGRTPWHQIDLLSGWHAAPAATAAAVADNVAQAMANPSSPWRLACDVTPDSPPGTILWVDIEGTAMPAGNRLRWPHSPVPGQSTTHPVHGTHAAAGLTELQYDAAALAGWKAVYDAVFAANPNVLCAGYWLWGPDGAYGDQPSRVWLGQSPVAGPVALTTSETARLPIIAHQTANIIYGYLPRSVDEGRTGVVAPYGANYRTAAQVIEHVHSTVRVARAVHAAAGNPASDPELYMLWPTVIPSGAGVAGRYTRRDDLLAVLRGCDDMGVDACVVCGADTDEQARALNEWFAEVASPALRSFRRTRPARAIGVSPAVAVEHRAEFPKPQGWDLYMPVFTGSSTGTNPGAFPPPSQFQTPPTWPGEPDIIDPVNIVEYDSGGGAGDLLTRHETELASELPSFSALWSGAQGVLVNYEWPAWWPTHAQSSPPFSSGDKSRHNYNSRRVMVGSIDLFRTGTAKPLAFWAWPKPGITETAGTDFGQSVRITEALDYTHPEGYAQKIISEFDSVGYEQTLEDHLAFIQNHVRECISYAPGAQCVVSLSVRYGFISGGYSGAQYEPLPRGVLEPQTALTHYEGAGSSLWEGVSSQTAGNWQTAWSNAQDYITEIESGSSYSMAKIINSASDAAAKTWNITIGSAGDPWTNETGYLRFVTGYGWIDGDGSVSGTTYNTLMIVGDSVYKGGRTNRTERSFRLIRA